VRPAVQNFLLPVRSRDRLKRCGAFGTQTTVGNGGSRIALDVDNLFVLDVNELAAADGAIRADRTYDTIGVFGSRHESIGSRGSGRIGQTKEVATLSLAGYGPLLKHIKKTRKDFHRFWSKEMGHAERELVGGSTGAGLVAAIPQEPAIFEERLCA
jgi:hypothetical protein